MSSKLDELTAISPIDGRYRKQTQDLSNYFSEYAYISYRLDIEIKYLVELSNFKIIRSLTSKELRFLDDLIHNFDLKECNKVKKIENKTKHDLKAIEYYIKARLAKSSLSDVAEYTHFGLTSEDVNNIAIRLMLKDSRDSVLLPSLVSLNNELKEKSRNYKNIVMLARTHGQPALPTTLGKEILVFSYRLEKEINKLKRLKLTGKLSGAVGNFNALNFAYPEKDWLKFSIKFINQFDLDISLVTTQINNPEDLEEFFQGIQRINGVVLDLNQDMWRYISDDWFSQENKKNEVGSSTMPHKINPIMFENSEGNLVVANSLIQGFISKLAVSRLQRDLSGSTVTRNFGICLAYALLSYENCLLGLKRLKPNANQIKDDLNDDWSILSEALQIFLKKQSSKENYNLIKSKTRGKKLTALEWKNLINKLPISSKEKKKLTDLTIESYTGII